MKSDLLNQQFIFGLNYNDLLVPDSTKHSIEFLYDVKGKIQGIRGLPITFAYASQCHVNPFMAIKTRFEVGKDVILGCSWIHAFHKNFRLVISDEKNLINLFHEPAKTNYTFGVMAEWNIV